MPTIEGGHVIEGSRSNYFSLDLGSPAAADTDAGLAAQQDVGATITILDTDEDSAGNPLITQPDVPRNVTATAGGTSGDVKAISVVVEGTNAEGNAITETLPAFTVNTTGTKTGSKAFATISKVTIPAHDGTGATTSVGFGSKLGLGKRLSRNTVKSAFLNGTLEGTAPTVAVSASAVESNTVTLNSALDGHAVVVEVVQ